MSAESDLRALLVATSAVTTLVGQRIAADRIEQGAARPFVVFSRTGSASLTGIDGTIYKTLVSIELQCWADTRVAADAVADAVSVAIRSAMNTVSGRSGGYDPDLDLEAALLTVEWWE